MSQENIEIFESNLTEEKKKRKQLACSLNSIQKALRVKSEVLPCRMVSLSCVNHNLEISYCLLFYLKINCNYVFLQCHN